MKKALAIVLALGLGIGIFRVPIMQAVTASYNSTVRMVDSAGNVIGGVASAVTANYNSTVRVVDSTGHVLDSLGGGSSTFVPETYGAKHDLVIAYDATMAAVPTTTATSTTPQAPAITTTVANEQVVSIIDLFATLTPPGTPTQRANVAGGATYGYYVGDQLVASANTSVPAQIGSQSSAEYIGGTIALAPTSGQTITFGNLQAHVTTGATITVTKPTGLAQGDFEIFCSLWFVGGSNTATPPTQFGTWPIFHKIGSDNSEMACYGHFATNSEPSSYSWTQTNGSDGATLIVWNYKNVLTVDDPLTVTTNNFTANDVGKLVTVENTYIYADQTQDVSTNFGTIVGFNSAHNVFVSGLSNATNVTLAGTPAAGEYHYGSDDKTPLTNAYNACVTAGGGQMVLGYSYASSDGIPLQSTVDCDIIGTKGLMPWFFVGNTGTAFKCGTALSAGSPVCVQTNNFGTSLGSGIDFISSAMTTAGLSINNAVGTVPDQNVVKIENLTLWHGAGLGIRNDSSAAIDGILATNVGGLQLLRNNVLGFSRDGIRYGDAGATQQSFAIDGWMQQNHVDLNGEYGININGQEDVQNTTLMQNEVEGNNKSGVKITLGADPGGGFLMENNIVQWDDWSTAASNPEILVSGPTPGCKIEGTWIEDSKSNGGFTQTGSGNPVQGCSFVNNDGSFVTSGTLTFGSSSHVFTNARVDGNKGFPAAAGVFDNLVVSPSKAPGISGGGSLSTGSNSFNGTITSAAATGNVLTPGFSCPNSVIVALQDDTTAGGAKVTASSATTVTFSATLSDTVDYTAGCR